MVDPADLWKRDNFPWTVEQFNPNQFNIALMGTLRQSYYFDTHEKAAAFVEKQALTGTGFIYQIRENDRCGT